MPQRTDGARLPYDWDAACSHLRARDKTLARLMDRSRPIRLELAHTQSLFHALAESIVYQQLSGKAAATIFGRVRAIYAPKKFPTPGRAGGHAARAPSRSGTLERENRSDHRPGATHRDRRTPHAGADPQAAR